MPSLATRSYQKELLDGNDIPFEDIRQNMRELDTINKILGGHRVTLKGINYLSKFLPEKPVIHIAEIGCGDGNNLRQILRWAAKNNLETQLTGIDINAECIRYAREWDQYNIQYIALDYKEVEFEAKPDIIFSSLFCHHFTDEELVDMLKWMEQNSALGFFINDLHRHSIPYYSIRFLTTLFSKSYLVKNDAPLSVKRGFKKKDWEKLFQKAGLPLNCKWCWAFRWLIIQLHAKN